MTANKIAKTFATGSAIVNFVTNVVTGQIFDYKAGLNVVANSCKATSNEENMKKIIVFYFIL